MSDNDNDNEEIKESIPYEDPRSALFSGEGWEPLGYSVIGEAIQAKYLPSASDDAPIVLLIGGVHGNETEGIRFMEEFTREFVLETSISPFSCSLAIIPVANPDGLITHRRQNANGVDLNRNMPTKDWTAEHQEERYFPGRAAGSEPETRALLAGLDKFQPDFIISFHSWKPMININGPAKTLAEKIKKDFNYPITEDIGYPTPGSLGTYAGWERNIPTITLEFERGLSLDTIYQSARQGVIDAISIAVKIPRDSED